MHRDEIVMKKTAASALEPLCRGTTVCPLRQALRQGLLSCLIFLAGASGTYAAEALTTTLSAVKRVYQKNGDRLVEKFVPFTKALPGDLVIYTIEYSNTGDAPATDLTITLPVPAEMTYVSGSADHPDAALSYSVDGSQTFNRLENLSITTAAGLTRPARAEDVTTLRWLRSQPLNAGASARLQYSAILK
jgi:uncharacterized repeat protein (TIGR01451 family)